MALEITFNQLSVHIFYHSVVNSLGRCSQVVQGEGLQNLYSSVRIRPAPQKILEKFTPLEGKILISSAEKDDLVEVSVEDIGIGIEKEKSSGLFDFNTFFMTNGTAREKGTGLGLSLCREFVERNGGKIWVDSEVGKGSKFTFTIKKQ